MSEEYLDEGQESSAGGPFLVIVGVLGAIFLLSLVCIAALLLSRTGGDDTDPAFEATRVAVVATNDAILTQNAFVAETLQARTLTAAAPTNTPTPPPTSTNTPTPTATFTPQPTATETPVINPDDGTEVATGPTVTPGSIFGTPIFGGGGATPTPVPVSGGGPGSGGTLPETGLPLWSLIGLAAGLVLLIGVARRLRTG
ncbi:MAG: hypothetical protein KJ063_22010 [Anaerolineae bacterium]|nr:hypothetical protein [Anaerolineae bacterium]